MKIKMSNYSHLQKPNNIKHLAKFNDFKHLQKPNNIKELVIP